VLLRLHKDDAKEILQTSDYISKLVWSKCILNPLKLYIEDIQAQLEIQGEKYDYSYFLEPTPVKAKNNMESVNKHRGALKLGGRSEMFNIVENELQNEKSANKLTRMKTKIKTPPLTDNKRLDNTNRLK
jgi:hypothetical protein